MDKKKKRPNLKDRLDKLSKPPPKPPTGRTRYLDELFRQTDPIKDIPSEDETKS
jgi:hypothetical protein